MAVLLYSEIEPLYLDAMQANVSVDKPVTTGAASEAMRDINDAYATVWELSGGSVKRVTSATAWTPAQSADTTGKATGIITDINEVLHLWATVTSGSVGGVEGEDELERVELSEIQFYRARTTLLGSYAVPKIFSLTRLATTTPADINKFALDYWPGVAGLYFPVEYVPQFTQMTATTDAPDVNDLESRDIAFLAARYRCTLIGRAELAPDIAAKVSLRTQQALERKSTALMSGKQDRP